MLFFTQLRFELQKMFSRKRTYIGFAAFLVLEILIISLLNLPKPKETFRHIIEQNGYGFDDYYSGTTLAMLILHPTSVLIGSLYLALVAADLVAKEVEEGTMRMVLCRPISRLRVTFLKYISAVIYTFVFIVFMGVTTLMAGFAYRGYGGLLVFAPADHLFILLPAAEGLHLYLLAIPLLALSLVTVSSLGFLFSCCNMKPAAATIVTLSVIFLDTIIHNIPYFESLKVWFITAHLTSWLHIFEKYPPVWLMAQDYTYLLTLDLTCFIVGSAIFLQRDLK